MLPKNNQQVMPQSMAAVIVVRWVDDSLLAYALMYMTGTKKIMGIMINEQSKMKLLSKQRRTSVVK